jgi:hypothetical protein
MKLIAALVVVALLAGGYIVRKTGADELTLDACVSQASSGFLASLPAEYVQHIKPATIQEGIKPLCNEMLKRPEFHSANEEDLPRLVGEAVRADPEAFRPLCNAVVDADFASLGELARFVSKRDRARFRRDLCRLGAEYVNDRGKLVQDHPGLFAPMCGAGIHYGLAEDPVMRKRLTQKQMRSIGRRSCMEALTTGVIDASGPSGFQDPKVDQRALEEIILRFTVSEARK